MNRAQVWKFPLLLNLGEIQDIEMPNGLPFKVDWQNSVPTIWALVSPDEPMTPRSVVVVGTGHDIPEHPTLTHVFPLGTLFEGPFVWHVLLYYGKDGADATLPGSFVP